MVARTHFCSNTIANRRAYYENKKGVNSKEDVHDLVKDWFRNTLIPAMETAIDEEFSEKGE